MKSIAKERDTSFDVLKGILILSVVLGHIRGGVIGRIIYMIQMPGFFLVSGYFFNIKGKEGFDKYFINLCKRIWIPYISYNFFFIILHNFFSKFNLLFEQGPYGFNEIVNRFLDVILFGASEQMAGAFWFLKILFQMSIVYFIIYRYIKKEWIRNIIIFLLILYGQYLSRRQIVLWNNFNSIASGIMFLHIGNLFKRYNNEKKINIIGVAVSLIIFIIAFINGEVLSILDNYYGFKPMLNVLAAIGGTYILLYISKNILNKSNILKYLGMNSIKIMAWHFVGLKLLTVIISLIKSEYSLLASFPVIQHDSIILTIMYLIVSVLFCIIMIKVENNVGKKIKQVSESGFLNEILNF